MSLKVLNSTFHSKQARFMRSDSTVAVSPSPVSTSIQNLSSNLALQHFSNLSSQSQSISLWNALSMLVNIAGVALMGLMTFNMFKGGSHQSSNGGRSNTVDHTITLKAEPIEVRAKGSSSQRSSLGDNSYRSYSGYIDDRELTQPASAYIERALKVVFCWDTPEEKRRIEDKLLYVAQNPMKDEATVVKWDLMSSDNFRSFNHNFSNLKIEVADESLNIIKMQAQAILLETLLGSIHKNYFLAHPEYLESRNFAFAKLLPELEKAVTVAPSRVIPLPLTEGGRTLIHSTTSSDRAELEHISQRIDERVRFLQFGDPTAELEEIINLLEKNNLSKEQFNLNHQYSQKFTSGDPPKTGFINCGGLKFVIEQLNSSNTYALLGIAENKSPAEVTLIKRELVWALKEAVEAKIAKKIVV